MGLSKVIVLKAVQLLVDTRELLLPISLNMVVCLNNKDPNQPDRWLISSLQASNTPVNNLDTVLHLHSLQVNTKTSKWVTEVLLVLVGTVVVLSKPQMHSNGLHRLLNKVLETLPAATRNNELHGMIPPRIFLF
jgi:hypothetical protein